MNDNEIRNKLEEKMESIQKTVQETSKVLDKVVKENTKKVQQAETYELAITAAGVGLALGSLFVPKKYRNVARVTFLLGSAVAVFGVTRVLRDDEERV